MKHLCLILAFSVIPIFGFCQNIGDSVIVFVDNRVEINVAIPDYYQLKSSDKVIVAMKEFIDILPDIKDQLSPGSADLVRFSVGSSVSVEPGDPKVIYLVKEGKLSNTGYRDLAVVSGDKFKIFITTSDLSKISDMSLSQCLEKVIDILPEKSNFAKSLYYECIDGKINALEDKNTNNGKTDFLEFSLGAGAGLVKSTWVADLSFGVGVGFSRKGVTKYFPYISTNLVFDFDDENNININTFLNLGYRWNIDKKADKPDFLGVELGYLVSNQGNLFGENTFRLSLNWSPVKSVFVSPQLYISDNFSTVYPGIRIGFGW